VTTIQASCVFQCLCVDNPWFSRSIKGLVYDNLSIAHFSVQRHINSFLALTFPYKSILYFFVSCLIFSSEFPSTRYASLHTRRFLLRHVFLLDVLKFSQQQQSTAFRSPASAAAAAAARSLADLLTRSIMPSFVARGLRPLETGCMPRVCMIALTIVSHEQSTIYLFSCKQGRNVIEIGFIHAKGKV
jgi:hypothetical protein